MLLMCLSKILIVLVPSEHSVNERHLQGHSSILLAESQLGTAIQTRTRLSYELFL